MTSVGVEGGRQGRLPRAGRGGVGVGPAFIECLRWVGPCAKCLQSVTLAQSCGVGDILVTEEETDGEVAGVRSTSQ